MSVREFSLPGVKSQYNGEFYIGFVMDVVASYLGGGNELTYYVGGGLSNADYTTVKTKINEQEIKVGALGDDRYFISGFPEDSDFTEFKRIAPALLETMLEIPTKKKHREAAFSGA